MSRESWKADGSLAEIISLCLSSDSEFSAKLKKWESRQSIDIIDGGLLRFIPFLYRRILDLNIDARDKNIMRGVYYKSWWYQTVFQQENVKFLESIINDFPRFALIKGVALQHSIYRNDPRTRPCDDVDILVDSRDRIKAVKYLLTRGFRLDSDYTLTYVMNFRKSASFVNDKISVDLNWGLFEYSRQPKYFRELELQLVKSGEIDFLTLADTENLIHTFLHGAGWNSVSSTRWIMDAALLVKKGNIDWQRFTKIVIANGWQYPLINQIEYLEEFEIFIPRTTKAEIASSKRDHFGEAMYLYQRQPKLISRRVLRFLYSDYLTYLTVNGFTNSLFNYFRLQPKVLKNFIVQYFLAKTHKKSRSKQI